MSPLRTNYFHRSLRKLNLSFKVISAKDPLKDLDLSRLKNVQIFKYFHFDTPNKRKQIC